MISLLLAAALAASPTVSLEHHGTLREVLKELAHKGGLNLVATGELDVPVEVYLKDVNPEEALASVARSYDLTLTHEGSLWIVKPAGGSHPAGALPMPMVAPLPPVAPVPPVAVVPPVAPLAPAAPGEAVDEAEAARAHAEQLREEADAIREQAEALRDQQREKAEELRQARREELDAARERAQAEAEGANHEKPESAVVSMTGRPVTVKAGEKVESAISYGGSVTIEHDARVTGDVVSFGGDVLIGKDAKIDGDAVSFGGKVQKEDGAVVRGEEVSFGASGVGSMVANNAVRAAHPHPEASELKGGSAVARFLAEFAVLFGVGFLLMMFFPTRMKTIEAELQEAPVKNGVAGLLAALCSLPLTLFLVITLIGIPVALAFWMLAGVCTLMGLVAVANTLGARVPVPRLRRTQAIALAVGLLAMLLVSRIPVAGPLLMSIATFVSLGAIIRTRIGQRGQGMPVPATGFLDSTPVA